MDNNQKLIIKTLLYSDIFDFPLLENEVWNYLISEGKVDKEPFDKELKKINSVVFRKNNYLFTTDRESIVKKRLKRIKESKIKLEYARKIIRKLFSVSTVMFIGISGNLSMLNSEKKDDIDIFVIVKKNKIWITRFFLIAMLKFMGVYRKRGEKVVSNKFCLNMLVDETSLKLSSNFQNLYTAHEVSQLMPIRERGGIYKKFIESNSWTTDFLPNIKEEIDKREVGHHTDRLFEKLFSVVLLIPFLEFFARAFQLHFINKNITSETVSNNFLAFHPRDYKSEVLLQYNKSLLKYGLS